MNDPTINILLVEDEDAHVELVHHAFAARAGKMSLTVAGSLREARAFLAESLPDLVLTDLVLPDGRGTALLPPEGEEARYPVVVMTAHGDEHVAVEVLKAGASYYVVKSATALGDMPHVADTALREWGLITERKRAEESLAEERNLLRTLIDTLPDHIYAQDKAGRYILANEAQARDLGADSPDEVVGKTDFDLYPADLAELLRENNNEVMRLDQSFATEEPYEGPDGERQLFWSIKAPLRDVQGELVGLVGMSRDLTERKRMEAELHRAQKLESLGVLAGGIAHDFNNLLTTILGNVSLAKTEGQKAGQMEVVDMLADAEKASLQAMSLTKQLLTFATGGAPVKVTASIATLLRESATFALRGSKVQSRLAIAEDLWPVDVDEGQMSQVINNLVINAQQALPQGGVVTVRAENIVVSSSRQDADSTELPGLTAGRYVAVSVEDEGVGIPADHLSQIFDPYFTTKQAGSGLGLTAAHSIIKGHGGHISVESTVGEGTTFHIYLPASSGQLVPARVEKTEIIPGQGKVLVMDDEEAVRGIAVRLLGRAGYEVEQAADGAEAIERYRQAHASGSPFDVVILDLTVPGGMGGVEAIRKLREFDPQVKAIVSSGYYTDAVMADFEGHGFSGVLPKPYKPEQLSQIVDAVLHVSTT